MSRPETENDSHGQQDGQYQYLCHNHCQCNHCQRHSHIYIICSPLQCSHLVPMPVRRAKARKGKAEASFRFPTENLLRTCPKLTWTCEVAFTLYLVMCGFTWATTYRSYIRLIYQLNVTLFEVWACIHCVKKIRIPPLNRPTSLLRHNNRVAPQHHARFLVNLVLI